jgi:hypothetical protein
MSAGQGRDMKEPIFNMALYTPEQKLRNRTVIALWNRYFGVKVLFLESPTPQP